jgi:hypothetical protein
MTGETGFLRLAALILRTSIRLAPKDAREWGNAALGELYHVEGNWAAVAWAIGGASVLLKQALIAIVMPWRTRQALHAGNPLTREARMHKASLITVCACLAAALLFFLMPVFQQAFRVSLAQWHDVFHVDQGEYWQPDLESFARRVEKNHDAEGMAFVAVRLRDGVESVRLANEAVRLDPKLIWIWGVVGARHAGASDVVEWAQKLEQWDPGNALPYLILAQRADIERGTGSFLHPPTPGTAWMEAMAAAFNSNRIDGYTDRLRALDRTVARRYNFNDPYFVVGGVDEYDLPNYTAWDSERYAKLTLASGGALETRGDLKGAIEKYLEVAHFVYLFDPHTHSTFTWLVGPNVPDLYRRLAYAYEKIGIGAQSAYFSNLATEVEQYRLRMRSEIENRFSVLGVTPWNALVIEISDAGMLASFCLLLMALIVVIAQRGTLNPRKLHIGPVTTALGFLGSVGLLVSSIVLYVTYRPYAAIYTRFLQTGDTSQLKTLSDFLELTRSPIGTQILSFKSRPHGPVVFGPYISVHTFTFYFWLAVIVLGVASLAGIAGRHLLKRHSPRAGAAA